MNRIVLTIGLVVGLTTQIAAAAEIVGQQRTITRTYVSPGASGSISESSRQEGSSGYGGYQVPDSRYNSDSTYQGSGSTQIRGNVQQSIEYPGVGEFQRQPGNGSVQRERR